MIDQTQIAGALTYRKPQVQPQRVLWIKVQRQHAMATLRQYPCSVSRKRCFADAPLRRSEYEE